MTAEKSGKNIILAVTGSIAAYKAASILRGLMNRGHQVRVIMTENARRFVTATTFRSLSGCPVVTELFVEEGRAGLLHIELAEWVDLLVVAPASANSIGKFACGLADDAVSCTWMASDCPKVVAPAMNDRMWASPAVQRNCEQLKKWNVRLIEPVEGKLASGKVAVGRLAPVETIVETVARLAQSL